MRCGALCSSRTRMYVDTHPIWYVHFAYWYWLGDDTTLKRKAMVWGSKQSNKKGDAFFPLCIIIEHPSISVDPLHTSGWSDLRYDL